jgi:N-acetylglucosamine kinase-like BadF-type ATPase
MATTKFVIGIDGGGTKTAASLADLQGNVLAEEVGGPSNFLLIGVEQAAETLFSVADDCCQKAGLSIGQVSTLVAGLTGAGRASEQKRMQEAFEKFSQSKGVSIDSTVIESDARIALEGAFRGGEGIILICGTGSIALGKSRDGRTFRVGGWGRMLGDEGSGFAIGRDGLNAITRHIDGRGKKTLLTELAAKKFNLKTQEEIITAVYRDHFDVAAVAPLVIEAAEQHDIEAERILNKATFELTEHVRTMTLMLESATREQARQKLPLAFIGSVISGESILTNILKHKITFSLPQISMVQPQASPSYGAVLLAINSTS